MKNTATINGVTITREQATKALSVYGVVGTIVSKAVNDILSERYGQLLAGWARFLMDGSGETNFHPITEFVRLD